MSRARTSRIALTLALALWPTGARAEDVSAMLEVLEENVVTGASRTAQRQSDAPALSSTITGEQLRVLGIKRLDQALNYLSLGMFAHDRLSTAEVGARGVALSRDFNSHVLIVLDGMVMNEQGGGAVFLHDVPIEVIDHVEVILGPGSVLYGAQAMLGVINIVTKPAAGSEGLTASGTVSGSPPVDADGSSGAPTWANIGHDNRFALTFRESFRLLGAPAGLVAGLDYTDFHGPKLTFRRQPLPRFTDGSTADLGPYAEPGQWGGSVSEQWFRRTTGLYTRLDMGELTWSSRVTTTELAAPQMDLFENRAPAAFDDPHNTNAYKLVLSNLRYETRFTERVTGMARLYFGYSSYRARRSVLGHDPVIPGTPLGIVDPEQCPQGPSGPCRKETRFFARWIGLELQPTYDWAGDGAYTTQLGLDGRLRTAAYEYVTFDEASGRSYGSDPAFTRWHGGGYKQGDEHALGAYLQQTLNPWKYLGLNAGVRVDFDSRIDPKYIRDAISPRVALLGTPTDNLSFKLIYSKAFRAPSFSEKYIVNGRLLPSIEGLSPETVSSYELVSSLRIHSYMLTLGGFYADWRNLIELQLLKAQAPSVSRFANVADVRNYGGTLSFEGAFLDSRLRTGLNSTLAVAKRRLSAEQAARSAAFVDGDSVPMAVAPRVYGNANVSYAFEDTTLAAAAGYFGPRIADQAYAAGEPTNIVPRPEAPAQLQLRGALTGALPTLRGVRYLLGVDYTFGTHQPYVVGPNQGSPRYLVPSPVDADLAPINRLSVFAGLELSLDMTRGLARAANTSASGAANASVE